MNSTPTLPIYVQLWLIPLDLSTQPVNYIYRIIPLLYSHLLSIESSYPIVSSVASRWEKPVALIKSLAKNYKCWVMSSLITFLILPRRALMIACFHHNGRQHFFTVSIKREVLKTCGNYSPISLLSFIPSKLLESISCFPLDSFLNQHNLVTA